MSLSLAAGRQELLQLLASRYSLGMLVRDAVFMTVPKLELSDTVATISVLPSRNAGRARGIRLQSASQKHGHNINAGQSLRGRGAIQVVRCWGVGDVRGGSRREVASIQRSVRFLTSTVILKRYSGKIVAYRRLRVPFLLICC